MRARRIVLLSGNERPSLDLAFALDKSLTARRGPTPAFTRASTGTFVNANGLIQSAAINVARFDHDPVGLACRGLLIEEQRTNLLVRSSELDNGSWTKDKAAIGANAVASPDGSISADKLVEDSAAGWHRAYVASAATNSAHTFSIYLKAAERTKALISMSDLSSGDASANIDLSAGTIGLGNFNIGGAWTNGSYSITPAGNGWYRCRITATKGAGSNIACMVFLLNNSNADSYAGDGSSGIYVWGAQLEAGAFPTSYVPTTSAAATRSADVCSISGADFAGFFNATAGALVSESRIANLVGENRGIVQIDSGVNEQHLRHAYGISNGGFYISVRANDTTQFGATAGTAGMAQKLALSYAGSEHAACINGGTVATVTRTAPAGLNRMSIGNLVGGSFYLSGHVARLRYYPKRLTGYQLQQLTR